MKRIKERQESLKRIKQFFKGFEFDQSKIDEVLAQQEDTLKYFENRKFRKKQMPQELAELLLKHAYKFFELLILHMQNCRVNLP